MSENWPAVLQDFLKGDRIALIKVSSVVTGYLARYRAYEVRCQLDQTSPNIDRHQPSPNRTRLEFRTVPHPNQLGHTTPKCVRLHS